AGIGVVGFVIGFALQDTLGNFASGIMILLYRPYDVGDVITTSAGTGKVSAMSLVSTTFHTPDNQKTIVPNSAIWGGTITNITAMPTRRVDMVVGVSYSDDLDKTAEVLTEIVTSHPKVHEDPAPVIRVSNLGDSSVDFVVRPWCNTADYWDVKFDLNKQIKQRLDTEGISIPFPQRDVHLLQQQAEA
ncbi:MAG: mechanosensitive ion channel family protein, partial [Planctomycetota bacterium]